MPMVLMARPSKVQKAAFIGFPVLKAATEHKESTITAKYSEGPNLSAISTSGCAMTISRKVAMVPAKKDPKAAQASAAPPRPLLAIW